MRAYIMIAAFAALAMIAVAHTASTEDRVIGAPDCTVDCPGQAADTDNGIGTVCPLTPITMMTATITEGTTLEILPEIGHSVARKIQANTKKIRARVLGCAQLL